MNDKIKLNIAVLTISDSRTKETDKSGNLLCKLIEESNHKTPFDVATRLKKESKNIAKESVKNDPLVKNLQDTFDATIDKVRPQ